MELTPELKRRLWLFGSGASVGLVFAIVILSYGIRHSIEKKPILKDVIISTCDLNIGDILTKNCVETRRVAEQLIPPRVLTPEDLDWHLGKKVIVNIHQGAAIRVVDFNPPTDAGYIR